MVKSPIQNEKIPKVKKNKSEKHISPSKSPTRNLREKKNADEKSTKNKKTSQRKRTRSQSTKKSHQSSCTSSNSENSSSNSDSESNSHNLYPKEIIINQSNAKQQSPTDLQPQNNSHQQYSYSQQPQKNQNYQESYPWQNNENNIQQQSYQWQLPQNSHPAQYYPLPNRNFFFYPNNQPPYFHPQNTYARNRNFVQYPQFNNEQRKRPESSEHALCLFRNLLDKQNKQNKSEHPNLNQDDFVFNFKNNFGKIFVDPETNITHVQLIRTYCFFTEEEQTRLEQYYTTNLNKNHFAKHDYANPCKEKLFRCPAPICKYSIINTTNTTQNILEHCKLFHQQNPLSYRYRDNETYVFVEYIPPNN